MSSMKVGVAGGQQVGPSDSRLTNSRAGVVPRGPFNSRYARDEYSPRGGQLAGPPKGSTRNSNAGVIPRAPFNTEDIK